MKVNWLKVDWAKLRLVLLGSWLSVLASAAPDPAVIEAYGDSLTAGFLTGTNLTAPPPLRGVTKNDLSISRLIRDMAIFRAVKDMTVLDRDHWRDLAWPAQLAKLQSKHLVSQDVRNYAISGAVVADLDDEVRSAKYDDQPTEAFFFIGHNDLCDNPLAPDDLAHDYFDQYSKALADWDSRHEGSVAYLIPLVNITRLYQTLQGYVWYRGVCNDGKPIKFTCESSWDRYFPYCTSHHEKFKKGQLESYILPRITAMNQALQVLAGQWDIKSHGHNHFYFLDHVFDQPFHRNYFAVDCFHLSTTGQAAIARTIDGLIQQHAL